MNNYSENVITIPNATLSIKDAAQYTVYNKRTQYNLCGHFSVLYCMMDKINIYNIDDFLDLIKEKNIRLFNSLFPNNVSRTTGIYDLEQMLITVGYKGAIPFKKFADIKVNQDNIAAMLKDYYLIAGVHIDTPHGYFVGSGIAHWVVLDRITIMDSKHAILDFYNPYNNLIEPYSYREFMITTGSYKNGLWIER